MFSISILADQAREAYGTQEGLNRLERIHRVAKTRMDTITASLNRIRELHLRMEPTDMRTLIDQALSDTAIPDDIRCEKHYCGFLSRCLVDEYHTRSALKNLFDNAAEALELSDCDDKVLSVSVDASRASVSISIRDNGPGIPPEELRRVMLPFVSSKSKNTNWGIGLFYAFRVINAQLGQMRIRSSDQPGRTFTQPRWIFSCRGKRAANHEPHPYHHGGRQSGYLQLFFGHSGPAGGYGAGRHILFRR